MADTPQTLALTVLAQAYAGDIVRQTNRKSMALRVIPIVTGAGKNIAWVPETSGAVAEAYADGADAANFGSDVQASATLPWALLRSNYRVTGLAQAGAATSDTPEGNIKLRGRNIANASSALASLVNGFIYSGNGAATPAEPTGLNSAIGDDTNTYAGIDRSTSAYFQPTVVDPGSATVLTQSQIRSDVTTIYTSCGENPDIALCAPAVFDKILGLFDSRQQFAKSLDSVTTARGEIQLTGNYRAIEVEGVTFLKDKDATAGYIYYLNTNYVEIQILVQPVIRDMLGFTEGQMLTANDGFGEVPLLAVHEHLAKTGDSDKAQTKTYLNLCVKRPNTCGVRKNVSTA